MGALIAAMGVFIFVLLGIVIAMYILSALALSTLAKNNGYADKAFFAWLPFTNTYLLGLLCGDVNLFGKLYLPANTSAILLTVLPLATAIPIVGFIVTICWWILFGHAIYNLLKMINPDNAVLMTVLAIIPATFISFPIYLFINREATLDNDVY